MPTVFPAYVVTRAQSCKVKDVVNLSKMFMAPQEDVVQPGSVGPSSTSELSVQATESTVVETVKVALSSPVTLPAESESPLKLAGSS